jgi:hypothetical protein
MAMAKKEHADDVIGTLQEEIVAMTTGVSDEDLVSAKAQLKYNMMMQMDGTSPNAEEIGRQMLAYGRRMSLAETFARIDAIEPEDVTRVAEKVIWDQEVALAAMGPNLKVGAARALARAPAPRPPPHSAIACAFRSIGESLVAAHATSRLRFGRVPTAARPLAVVCPRCRQYILDINGLRRGTFWNRL